MSYSSESERRAWFPGDVVLGMTDECHVDHVCAKRPDKLIPQIEYTVAKVANEFIKRMVKK